MPIRRMVGAGLLAIVSVLSAGQAEARTLDQAPAYLASEGNFVRYPAFAGAAIGGAIGAVISLPADLVAGLVGTYKGDTVGYAAVPFSLFATGGAEAGYHVFGAIPYAVKKVFYDAPMYGIAKAKGERPSGTVAQVDPPPMDPMLNQYLASTPPAARVPVQLDRSRTLALKPPPELTSLMLKRSLSPFVLPPEVARQFQNIKPVANIPLKQAPVVPAPAAAEKPAESAPVPPTASQREQATAKQVAVPAAEQSALAQAPDAASPVPRADAPDGTAPSAADRPTLKRPRKKSFSERFGF